MLADKDLRAMMLTEAKAEMQSFAKKYRALVELAPVITAIDAAIGQRGQRGKREAARAVA